jgi:hypothetical protein
MKKLEGNYESKNRDKQYQLIYYIAGFHIHVLPITNTVFNLATKICPLFWLFIFSQSNNMSLAPQVTVPNNNRYNYKIILKIYFAKGLKIIIKQL